MINSETRYSPLPGYVLLCAGVAMAFISAVVPFYDDGYRLHVGVLLAGLVPYLVYVIPLVLLPRTLTLLAGIVLVAIHGWLVSAYRFSARLDYSDGMIFTIPMALALVPLAVLALRKPWRDVPPERR
jgi:hypothetical protein